jgi:hypothetical protein
VTSTSFAAEARAPGLLKFAVYLTKACGDRPGKTGCGDDDLDVFEARSKARRAICRSQNRGQCRIFAPYLVISAAGKDSIGFVAVPLFSPQATGRGPPRLPSPITAHAQPPHSSYY